MRQPMLKAILILPFNVLITIPAIILYCSDFKLLSPSFSLRFIVALGLLIFGLSLLIWTISLFAAVQHGSLAPWNPINRLIISGPYAYVRNPMLSGVFLVLFGESALFSSWPLFLYTITFIAINAVYFPLSEEKGLQQRFGQSYIDYCHHVPRFIPRLSPYNPNQASNHSKE